MSAARSKTLSLWFSERTLFRVPRGVIRYVVALGWMAIAFAIRYALTPLVGGYMPFVLFLPAAMLATWQGRWRPGLIALVGGLLLGDFFFLSPAGGALSFHHTELIMLLLYFAAGLTGIMVVEALHRRSERLGVSEASQQGLKEKMTERKQAEAALQESETRLRQLAENIHEVFWLVTPNWEEILYISPAYEEIWGRPCVSLYHSPQSWLEAVVEEDRPAVRATVERGMADASMLPPMEYRITRPDGTLRWIRDRAWPVRDARGNVVRIAGIAEDITERKEATERVARQVQRMELLSEVAAELLCVEDPAQAIEKLFQKLASHGQLDVYFNYLVTGKEDTLELRSYAGISREVAQTMHKTRFGQPVCGLVARERKPVVAAPVQECSGSTGAMMRRLGLRAFACHPLLANGRLLGTLCFGSRTRQAFSEEELEFFRSFCNYVAMGSDRLRLLKETRQRAAELQGAQAQLRAHAKELERRVAERTERLRGSLKSLEGVLYHVAHDLRAPLRAMHSFTELLLQNYAPQLDAVGEDYARRIAQASDKMDTLIRDLLDYGRLAHQNIECTAVDLTALLDQLLAELNPEARNKHAQILLDRPLPVVWGDEKILEQVLANLLVNALKFVAPGNVPHIHLWAETNGQTVRLNVQDEGIGIAPEHQERIFGIFERLHDNEIYPGTGIGLAIAKKGMERLGGRIGVDSQPGRGSCFWLELKPSFIS